MHAPCSTLRIQRSSIICVGYLTHLMPIITVQCFQSIAMRCHKNFVTRSSITEAKPAKTIAERDAMKAELEGKLANETKLRKDSETKNQKLYDYNVELMHIYAAKSCSDSLLQREPFTGIKQVEIENILEDYSYKLDQQKVDTKAAVPTPSPAKPWRFGSPLICCSKAAFHCL
jgi:hypothetical protein